MRERTYWPELCLVQLGGAGTRPRWSMRWRQGIDLAPLGELLADPAVIKVFHAARQDVEIFLLHSATCRARCSTPRSPRWSRASATRSATTRWSRRWPAARSTRRTASPTGRRRPLSARADHLRRGRRHPSARGLLSSCARGWSRTAGSTGSREEMAVLADPATYRADPEAMWERLKPRSSNRRLLGLLRAAGRVAGAGGAAHQHPAPAPAEGRDAAGDRRHRARTTPEELARARGIGRGFAEGRSGAWLLAALAEARRCPTTRCRRRRAAATAHAPRRRWWRC